MNDRRVSRIGAAPQGGAQWAPDRFYRAYWEGAQEGLYVVRCLGEQGFVYEGINPAHERATGLSRARLVGRRPEECLDAKVAQVVSAHYGACVRAGEPIHYVETLDLPAGRKIWETTLVPVRGADGKVEVLLGSCRDITGATEAQRELSEVAERLLEVQEEERRRIASELHDSTSQHLVALQFGLTALRRGGADAETLEDMRKELSEALREVRTLSYLLHPPTLAREGLEKTLRAFARGFAQRTALSIGVSVRGAVDSLPNEAQRALFRVAQEAMANAHRHSPARRISVDLRRGRTGVRLTINDDGGRPGQPPPKLRPGVGIPGMEARIQRLGGSFSITAGASGTQVSAVIPALAPEPLGQPKVPRPSASASRVRPVVSGRKQKRASIEPVLGNRKGPGHQPKPSSAK
jgi:PAS domain S-box-containing protein